MKEIDEYDRKILSCLQTNAAASLDTIAGYVALSRNAIWRRIKVMEEAGIITGTVARIDPEKVGCGLTALVFVRTSHHEKEWLAAFSKAVQSIAHIVEAYRMSGDLDYMLKVRVQNMRAYDRFYQKLISYVPLSDVSASFVMEELKKNGGVPLEPL